MLRIVRISLALVLLLSAAPLRPAAALQAESACQDGIQASGAIYRICMPDLLPWNGDLVVYAHGYVAYNQPIGIPEDQLSLPGGGSLADLVTSQGYAFATTSYSVNGLAVNEGIADLLDLAAIFKAQYPGTNRVYLAGASEGGLITTLGVERYPDVFTGGLAACGPIGDFQKQINYWGDFRVVFDYFFRSVLPPSPVAIPQPVIDNWETTYLPAVEAAVLLRPSATSQLLAVTGAPTDPAVSATITETVGGLLWYNVFATNDGIQKLHGQPFDNTPRWYSGSNNDLRLNRRVQRFDADPAAGETIKAYYQTSGALAVPLVTLHTTGDPIVPYWHETLYNLKTVFSGALLKHINIPIVRYGHCAFTAEEVLFAFALLTLQTAGTTPAAPELALKDPAAVEAYQQMLAPYLDSGE
jgi:pimeloyl-ACP methyl ester carboxylesterase